MSHTTPHTHTVCARGGERVFLILLVMSGIVLIVTQGLGVFVRPLLRSPPQRDRHAGGSRTVMCNSKKVPKSGFTTQNVGCIGRV